MKQQTARMFCIDDDPLALDQLRGVIERLGAPIDCSYFGSPKKAADAHRDAPADIVISDLRLGATTGLKLISEMQLHAPDSIYMLLSGEADLDSALAAMNDAKAFRFFTKPALAENLGTGIFEAVKELHLRQLRTISGTTLSALEHLNTAIASVDLSGRLVYANTPAQRILDESGFFDVSDDNVLRSVDPKVTRKFQDFLKLSADTPDSIDMRRIFRFSSSERSDPITITAIPAEGRSVGDFCFNLIISDPARKEIVDPERLGIALGITPSEARVVYGLIEYGSVSAAAGSAGVSLSTARTYLKNVYSKTGVTKQAELVRLALLTAA